MYIVATIGPRSCDNKTIDAIVKGGANTIRINLSHGKYEEIDKVIGYINRNYHEIKILMDLQGHKIRVSDNLKKEFFVDNSSTVYFCSYEEYDNVLSLNFAKVIPLNISEEQIQSFNSKKIYMKDAIMKFNVIAKGKNYIKAVTVNGGMVRSEKGCNLPGISRENLELTDKDKKDIQFALNEKVDILCYSYCSSNYDCEQFKENVFKTLRRGDKIPRLFGKIETKEAVKNISLIAEHLDGVVIARGDLVPESDLYALPIIQDKIINNLSKKDKEVIVATHVLSSMKREGVEPSIGELSDIYNMIRKKANGFMLTGETTIGTNQFEVVSTLKKIVDYYVKINKKIVKNKK